MISMNLRDETLRGNRSSGACGRGPDGRLLKRPRRARLLVSLSLLVAFVVWPVTGAIEAAATDLQGIEPDLQKKIDAAVLDVLTRTEVPSASIALVSERRLIYAQAYGNAALEPRRAALPSMRYAVGSISKEFTAAALLLLAEDGRLSLDDAAGKYADHLGPAARVTVRQLLSHTAGVRDFWPQDFVLPGMLKPVSAEAIIARWGAQPLDFEPGSAWQYSNTGYTIAGVIAEKVGGRRLFQQLSERVFRPLGMSSVIDVDTGRLEASDVTGYLRYALGPLHPARKEAPGWLFAAGGLAMTASDLARWDIALMDRRILSASSLSELSHEIVLRNGAGTKYALGLDVELRSGRRVLGHGGEIDGFTAYHLFYPDDGMAVVVLCNQEAVDASETIANALADLLLTRARPADAAVLDQDRRFLKSLQQGTLDTRLLTENARSYFSPEALLDFKQSLAPLGEPTAFELTRSSLRGGLVTRFYRVTFSRRQLRVVVRATPEGLFEQYTVAAE
jgi:D-alanyl-D-alanine carboxypeptidase